MWRMAVVAPRQVPEVPVPMAVPAPVARVAALSPREREVLKRLVAGQTNQAIAHDLKLLARTVEIHQARMLDKLGVESLAEAIQLAVLAGL
jgi:two-component system response regulator FixJ